MSRHSQLMDLDDQFDFCSITTRHLHLIDSSCLGGRKEGRRGRGDPKWWKHFLIFLDIDHRNKRFTTLIASDIKLLAAGS